MSGQERGGESPPPSRSNPEQLDNPKGGSGAMSQNDTDQQHDANKRTLEKLPSNPAKGPLDDARMEKFSKTQK